MTALPRLRTRLALLHTALAFVCSVVVLGVVALGMFNGSLTTSGSTNNLTAVLRYAAVALVPLAVASIALGWMIAGRALRPLDTITRAARSMSAQDLETRLRVPPGYSEFTELAGTLDGLLRRLHESFAAQRQFVANASHELRTPLTVQRTLLQLTLADPDASADTLRSACEELLDLGRQQEQLIDALLTLATGYDGIDQRERFDLADLTSQIVLEHQPEAEARGIQLCTALTPATITGDVPLTASLVTNLLANAIRHNVPGGTVDIATADGRLTVTNTGRTIPPDEISRLTEPFQRAQSQGHGLGLAIITAVARAHGAQLTIEPNPAGGLHVTYQAR
ncbi:sensor histidine kinase [Kribbella soli]|uniref:histidine kinase n=1 Tax=Kribbella soli TaxID=1124743 RepID=A0A4R0HKD0_9ACTN|nr:ATP-binding protein [Kribbella soli]TCC08219.1 HAMP domain-containing protein [Kribbella soli]